MLNTILFPTDFSPNADHAFQFAIDLARKTGTELVILHVYDIPLMAPSSDFTTREATMAQSAEQVLKASDANLEELVSNNDLSGIPHRCESKMGNVVGCIEELCKEEEIGMVVMGTLGASGIAEVLLGSVTSAVIRAVECPVLAVPMEAQDKEYNEMVYATELKYDESNTFTLMTVLAEFYGANLTFLHINTEEEESVSKEEQALYDFIEASSYAKVAYVERKAKSPIEGIEAYIQEHSADLLAMTTHTVSLYDRLFHKSVTRQEALHSKVPLLAFSQKLYNWTFL